MAELLAKILGILGKVELAATLAIAYLLYHAASAALPQQLPLLRVEDYQMHLINFGGILGIARLGAWGIRKTDHLARLLVQRLRKHAVQRAAIAQLEQILHRGSGGEYDCLLSLRDEPQTICNSGDPFMQSLIRKGIAYRSGSLIGYSDGSTRAAYSLTPACACHMEERDGDDVAASSDS